MDEPNNMRSIFEKMQFIEQFAETVVDATSKFNNAFSVSYAPENITGKPAIYPCYGDYPETYMLRTYGKWWNESESSQKHYMSQDKDEIESEDYIIIKFEQAIVATRILIYETFNPGAVVRIWGGKGRGFWTLLWQGPPQKYPKEQYPKSVTFSPELRVTQDLIHLIRIEFNQSELEYHTAIDAVLLAGYRPKHVLEASIMHNGLLELKGLNQKKKKKISYDTGTISEKSLFLTLPLEVIVYIFGFLDLRSLSNCSLVNHTFRAAANDHLLYRDLSFKRYWNRITDRTLQHFELRCKLLRKLDLTWCGIDNKITEEGFVRFIKNCGTHLTHLALNKCDFFLHEKSLDVISMCKEIVDLRLRHCFLKNTDKYLVLAELTNIKSLDLYSSNIDDQSLLKIIKNNRNLQHLIIDLCDTLAELDLITEMLSIYNKKLRTFSCWKTHTLTGEGIKSLSKCNELRELDVGWCLVLSDLGDCLSHIAQGCPNLIRLILSGFRGLSDNHLLPVVRNCHKIQQLDLLGTRNITSDICDRALKSFPDLKMLDISFCDGISLRQVENWRYEFPNVIIYRSCAYTAMEHRHNYL